MSGSAAPALRPHGYFRKREKTRARLLEAAKRVMAGKGVEATTIAEIAAAADVAPGTFYNYFTTREEILDAVATSLVEEFRRVMSAIQRTVDDPAERISIAIRLFLRDQTRDIIRERIVKEGLARKRFRLPSTRAVGDLITGTTVTALRSILEGRLSLDVAAEVAELVLRGLGVPFAEAHDIAIRPIPSLGRAAPGKSGAAGSKARARSRR